MKVSMSGLLSSYQKDGWLQTATTLGVHDFTYPSVGEAECAFVTVLRSFSCTTYHSFMSPLLYHTVHRYSATYTVHSHIQYNRWQSSVSSLCLWIISRHSIGLNLAMAELYIVLDSMFRRSDIDLYHTTRERDIDVVRDCFVGEPCRDSVGVRVKTSPVR
jgi:hypothetical protein